MKLFDVYPRFNVEIKKASGAFLYDNQNQKYLDLYGGHGVISIGHTHLVYTAMIKQQLEKLGFYSNSVQLPIQEKLATQLTTFSGYPEYTLFLCNSGAEANENALKLASFHTGKKRVIAFKNSFHGRTAAALSVTDNPNLLAPLHTETFPVDFLPLNDRQEWNKALEKDDICAVIVEGIQGVGGLDMPEPSFLQKMREDTRKKGIVLILDEIQSGYGRSGKFFAHQFAGIKPDLITMAKGMGNGFPIAGVLISPEFEARAGMLGTTFGGNPLACAAGLAVLHVMQQENLMENVHEVNDFLIQSLSKIPQIKEIKGKGLMLGLAFDFPVQELRKKLLYEHHILTGSSANPNLLRILPPLSIQREQIAAFPGALKKALQSK
ncbi:aminotransferase class III-fold pyridoxal phosphate-dependent enzyme [Candidatus Sulfidibacterium hydrothermale]|uniref:aspartate aminotransferase family protein n=1 Tax=Candidatus Sulfidibacterium hydrothermale TaxID=2875962 RepID=UPI001F0AFEF0|nr:aminotransferase class III-fold pyridoxal phosphate-dependent enzyme [Candidatus Sulfidibacterium hydrothermale]UBM61406.1 aminotransferase class III-fold pyridoxal phosphate-dependent enzyme [Candidatus Sulfidibacterium hydrothermale]